MEPWHSSRCHRVPRRSTSRCESGRWLGRVICVLPGAPQNPHNFALWWRSLQDSESCRCATSRQPGEARLLQSVAGGLEGGAHTPADLSPTLLPPIELRGARRSE